MKKVAEQLLEQEEVQQEVQPTEIVLNLDLANSVLNYLVSRPYGEVAELIKGIQDSKLQ